MPKVPLATSICLITLFVNLLSPLSPVFTQMICVNTHTHTHTYIYIHVYIYVDMYTTAHNGTEESLPYHKLTLKHTVVGVILPIYNNINDGKQQHLQWQSKGRQRKPAKPHHQQRRQSHLWRFLQ